MLLSMKTIAEWLNEELGRTGLSQADLARKSGISTAQIARAVNGTRGLSEESITSIAEAFEIPAEQAFREIGILPPVPPDTEQDQQLLYLFHKMTREKRAELLSFAKYLINRD